MTTTREAPVASAVSEAAALRERFPTRLGRDGPRLLGGAIESFDFSALIAEKRSEHLAGTREWVFDAVEEWRSAADSPQLFWLMGGGGTGKSVTSAELVVRLLESDSLIGWHFCKHTEPHKSWPLSLLRSLSAQCATRIPGFEEQLDRHAVMEALSTSVASEAFEVLLAAPLRAVDLDSEKREKFGLEKSGALVLVIDALDELPDEGKIQVLHLISENLGSLPSWVKMYVTSREELVIKQQLSKFAPTELRCDEGRNRLDVRRYLSHICAKYVDANSASMAAIRRDCESKFPGVCLDRLEELELPLRLSKEAYEGAVAALKMEPHFAELENQAELRDPDLRQPHADVGKLWAEARVAQEALTRALASAWEPSSSEEPGGGGMRIPSANANKPGWVCEAVDPGVKGQARAMQKLAADYDGDAAQLKDLSRLSLVFETPAELLAALKVLSGCFHESGAVHEDSPVEQWSLAQIKNKFASPTPLGYRDVNTTLLLRMSTGVEHLCEVQLNLRAMVEAKRIGHAYYEQIRSALPEMCKGTAVDAARLEAYIVQRLNTSALDGAVHLLERKAQGLMLYARLIEQQLDARRASGNSLLDFTALAELPASLGAVYASEFDRVFAEKPGLWEQQARPLVELLVAAMEPLSVTVAASILGWSTDPAALAQNSALEATSILFPVREGLLTFYHKTVSDWLLAKNPGEAYFVDARRAHRRFSRWAASCLLAQPRFLDANNDASDAEAERALKALLAAAAATDDDPNNGNGATPRLTTEPPSPPTKSDEFAEEDPCSGYALRWAVAHLSAFSSDAEEVVVEEEEGSDASSSSSLGAAVALACSASFVARRVANLDERGRLLVDPPRLSTLVADVQRCSARSHDAFLLRDALVMSKGALAKGADLFDQLAQRLALDGPARGPAANLARDARRRALALPLSPATRRGCDAYLRRAGCALRCTLEGAHTRPVRCLGAFAAEEGRPRLFTASDDANICIWDPVGGGEALCSIGGHTDCIHGAACYLSDAAASGGPGSTALLQQPRLGTGCIDGRISLWDLAPAAQADLSNSIAMASAAQRPTASHPLAGRTVVLLNTTDVGGGPINKYCSFTSKDQQMRAVYSEQDAMPSTLMAAEGGTRDTYTIFNAWPGMTVWVQQRGINFYADASEKAHAAAFTLERHESNEQGSCLGEQYTLSCNGQPVCNNGSSRWWKLEEEGRAGSDSRLFVKLSPYHVAGAVAGTGEPLRRMIGGAVYSTRVLSMAAGRAGDGRAYLATGHEDNALRLWDDASGHMLAELPFDRPASLLFFQATAGQLHLAAGTARGKALVYSVAAEEEEADDKLRLLETTTLSHSSKVAALTSLRDYGQEGHLRLVAGTEDGTIRCWTPSGLPGETAFEEPPPPEESGGGNDAHEPCLVRLEGAGSAEANGVYVKVSERLSGEAWYWKDDDARCKRAMHGESPPSMWFNGGQWRLGWTGVYLYTHSDRTAGVLGGWQKAELGKFPAPRGSDAEAHEPHSVCLEGAGSAEANGVYVKVSERLSGEAWYWKDGDARCELAIHGHGTPPSIWFNEGQWRLGWTGVYLYTHSDKAAGVLGDWTGSGEAPAPSATAASGPAVSTEKQEKQAVSSNASSDIIDPRPRGLTLMSGQRILNALVGWEDGERRLVACGSEDHSIRVFDLTPGAEPRCVAVLDDHTAAVLSLAAFRTASGAPRFAAGDASGTVLVFDPRLAARGTPEVNSGGDALRRHSGTVLACASFSLRGGADWFLATAAADSTLRVWRVAAGNSDGKSARGVEGEAWTVKHAGGSPRCVCALPRSDGALLFTGSEDGCVRLFGFDGADRFEHLRELPGHGGTVNAVCLVPSLNSSNYAILASGSSDRTVRACTLPYDLLQVGAASSSASAKGTTGHRSEDPEVASHPFAGATVKLLNVYMKMDRFVGARNSEEGDRSSLASNCDMEGAATFVMHAAEREPHSYTFALAGSEAPRWICRRAGEGQAAALYLGAATGEAQSPLELSLRPSGGDKVFDGTQYSNEVPTERMVEGGLEVHLCLAPDTGLYLSFDEETSSNALHCSCAEVRRAMRLKFVPVAGQEAATLEARTLQGHSWDVLALCAVPCAGRGTHLLASASRDFSIKIWDALQGTCLATLQGHSHAVTCLASTSQGLLLSGSFDRSLRVWDPLAQEPKVAHVASAHAAGLDDVIALAEDGEGQPALLATVSASNKTLALWRFQPTDPEPLAPLFLTGFDHGPTALALLEPGSVAVANVPANHFSLLQLNAQAALSGAPAVGKKI